jgi:hypothetical protein
MQSNNDIPMKNTAKNKNIPLGDSYLHMAVRRKDVFWVQQLIHDGASALKKNNHGKTSLELASENVFGVGYDIFMMLVARARSEILTCPSIVDYDIRMTTQRKNIDNFDVETKVNIESEETFAGRLLDQLKRYHQEVITRSIILKVIAYIFNLDKTDVRNKEQAEIYKAIHEAVYSEDYGSLMDKLGQFDDTHSNLHKLIADFLRDGADLLPDDDRLFFKNKESNDENKEFPLKQLTIEDMMSKSEMIPSDFIDQYKRLYIKHDYLEQQNNLLIQENNSLNNQIASLNIKLDNVMNETNKRFDEIEKRFKQYNEKDVIETNPSSVNNMTLFSKTKKLETQSNNNNYKGIQL